MVKFRSAILLMLILITGSCEDAINSNIPNVPVHAVIDVSRAQYNKISIPGQSMVLPYDINGYEIGYAGVIVYRADQITFYAFDRCCTNFPEQKHRVNPDGGIAICPVDSSVFVLADGSGNPTSGSKAKLPLRMYHVDVSNYPKIAIYN